ncbi:MAG: hypothetical protein HPY85_02745 [Anaerolineae bacterium]|jgi:hypothetical protein|nr:hypothetical protein [Anaerolineae bacterium]
MNADTELIFPLRLIPELRDLRGKPWQVLIDHLLSDEVTIADQLGFGLLMVELGSCNSCNSYSFRAMRGCATCAISAVQRFRDSDEALVALYQKKRSIMLAYLQKHHIDLDRSNQKG